MCSLKPFLFPSHMFVPIVAGSNVGWYFHREDFAACHPLFFFLLPFELSEAIIYAAALLPASPTSLIADLI